MSHCYDKLELYSLWRKWTTKIKTPCPPVWLVCLMWFTEGLLNIVNWLSVVRQKLICILFLFSCLIRTFHSSFRIVISFWRGLLHILFTVVRFPCRAGLYFWCSAFAPQKSNNWIWSYAKWPLSENYKINIYRFFHSEFVDRPNQKPKKNRYWKRRKPHRKL